VPALEHGARVAYARVVPTDPTLVSLFARHATREGIVESELPGAHFYRVSEPVRFRKAAVFGPRLIVVAQGKKIARFAGGELAYDEDHYLVVTGGTQMEGVIVDASANRPYLAMCLALSPDVVARTLLALADASVDPETNGDSGAHGAASNGALPAFVSPLDEAVTSTIVRMLRALDDPLDRRVVAPLVVEELVFRLLRTSAAGVLRASVRQGDASIQEAMRYMRENATRALTVERVARHVGMSGSHFAHRFSAVARVSPMRFLKQVRLEAARELLIGRRMRASEAAIEVGYESASHFTRDFKSAYGAAPREYVRRVLEG